MPYIMAEPVKPPKMAWKSKAPAKMLPNTWGSICQLSTTITSATKTESPPIKGTSVEVKRRMRLPPPMTQ